MSAAPAPEDSLASESEAYHFFFERLGSLSLAARTRLGLSPSQANAFCQGLAQPFMELMSFERLRSLHAQRRLMAPGDALALEALDSLFALAAESSERLRSDIERLEAQASQKGALGPLNLRFDLEAIAPASLPPERAFVMLAQLLSSSAGDAKALKNDEQTRDFLRRYTASMSFLIGLCAEESLLDWMPSAVNSICFSRLGWQEQWASSKARAAYSALYLGLLPKLARGFQEPEAAFACVLKHCAPSYPSIEAERSAALSQAAACETRRRLWRSTGALRARSSAQPQSL